MMMVRLRLIATTLQAALPATLLAATLSLSSAHAQSTSSAQTSPTVSSPVGTTLREEMGRWREIYTNLTPEGRRLVSDYLRSEAQENRNFRPRLMATRDKIGTIMAAESFDAEALRRMLAEERALIAASQQRRHEASVAMLVRLSAPDRRLVIEQLLRTMQAGREQGRRLMERLQERQSERP